MGAAMKGIAAMSTAATKSRGGSGPLAWRQPAREPAELVANEASNREAHAAARSRFLPHLRELGTSSRTSGSSGEVR